MSAAAVSSDNSIHIEMSEDNHSVYQIKVPFQITFISCSGGLPQDLLSITTLSGQHDCHYQQTLSVHHKQYGAKNLHLHDYFELLVVLEGTIGQMIEDKEYFYTPGSCCLINRSLYHLENYTDRAKVLFIGFSVDFIKELFEQCNTADFPQEKEILNSSFYKFIMDDIKNPGSKTYLDFIPALGNQTSVQMLHDVNTSIMEVMLHPTFGATHQIKGLFSLLIASLSNPEYFHCSKILLEENSDVLIFARISHLIEERSGRVTRDELSRQLNYSGDYINRIVNKFTGLCLFDYSMNFCMKKAADELLHSKKTIGEIANDLHFSNRTHFYKLFKEKYGMTPKEFRFANKE
jgi:AraC-like DNA-binding protein/mannose-6-phosphate isomerase-like protein (cupin superfamily)